jgi:choline kinase
MGASLDTGFDFEDITGLPWIEIDFTRDIKQARNVILPRIRKKLGNVLRVGAGRKSITTSQSNQ